MILGWLSALCLAAAGLGCLSMLAAAVLIGRFARGAHPCHSEAKRNEEPDSKGGFAGAETHDRLSRLRLRLQQGGLDHRDKPGDPKGERSRAPEVPDAKEEGSKPNATLPPVTILKPLHGDEPLLYENLASFCTQDYDGPVQIVFGVQDTADPAIAVVRRLMAAFPDKSLDLVIDPHLHGANSKVSNLVNMAAAIRHEIVVLADSDMRVPPDYLARVVAALYEPGVGLVTCLYHGVPVCGRLWSRLSALAIDTHFLPNVVMGVSLGLAHPCFGSTIALRRTTLEDIGGFEAFADILADDYAIGAAVRAAGHTVNIPPFTIGHVCTEETMAELWRHEVRWARTIRSVDPAGFAGLAVTHAFPLALIGALAGRPSGLLVAAAAVACRITLCVRIERAFDLERRSRRLVPLRDLFSFAVFVWSLFGVAVSWKGSDYRVNPDGTLLTDRRSPVP